jgi:predicted DNA-binding antitoxin AbrB/MazE fold protein
MELAPMITNIRAIYEGGVLRPIDALSLQEGEAVNVVITQVDPPDVRLKEPTPAEVDYARKIREAKSLKEMFAVMATSPSSTNEMTDVVTEINQSRRLTGFRQPDPEASEENCR